MTEAAATDRVASIDVLRGAVMVVMTLDHVRDFSGIPQGGRTPGLFFTRWISHFSAPAFIFLAGVGIFLYGRKLGGRSGHGRLARDLLLRGAWLVFLALSVLRFFWTFDFDFTHEAVAGIIWVIGWSMIAMAVLIHLPNGVVGALGFAAIAAPNLLDARFQQLAATMDDRPLGALGKLLYFGPASAPIEVGGVRLTVLYTLVPWIGVMALGYVFGSVLEMEPARRRRWCLALGGGAIALFLVLRGFDLYGDPNPWRATPPAPIETGVRRPVMPAALRFLNTNKYPASFLFLLMTLGPLVAAIPFAETARGAVARALAVYGRVPFFYFLLHIPVAHLAAIGISLVREGRIDPWLLASHPIGHPNAPPGYAWSLPLLYSVTLAVVAALYLPCRGMGRLKQRRRDAWLRYV